MKICKIEGCNNKHNAKGYCKKHYEQIRRYGRITNKNEIIIYSNYAEMILYDKNNNEKARTLIDLDDIEKIKQYKWCITSKGYVIGNVQNDRILLHRFIMNCPNDMVIDHINRNKLDNRKSNLRICTIQENDFNKSTLKNNTSNVTGVNFNNRVGKWRAYISINRKQIHLGWFVNKEDAIKARQRAEIQYFGEFC